MKQNNDYKLRLVTPQFGSKLTSAIIELNHLKKREIYGSTQPIVFFQVKAIFHMLESLASARIEGNHTTISDYVEARLDKKDTGEQGLEISNIYDTLKFIDKHIDETPINTAFLRQIHNLVVKNLSPGKEGCRMPGIYRKHPVEITNSNHTPPQAIHISNYMDELFDFINDKNEEQFDLIKTALTHHRFAWIHPFENGNGRTIRMLTYAMLIKDGFNVNQHNILNPTAIFCNDRNRYYEKLANADKGTDDELLQWCEYVIRGLNVEIKKIDNLLNYKYLSKKIITPALNYIQKRQEVSPVEFKISEVLINKQTIRSIDIKELFTDKSKAARSQALRRMVDKKILRKMKETKAHYALEMSRGPLLRGIINSLKNEGFVPESLDKIG